MLSFWKLKVALVLSGRGIALNSRPWEWKNNRTPVLIKLLWAVVAFFVAAIPSSTKWGHSTFMNLFNLDYRCLVDWNFSHCHGPFFLLGPGEFRSHFLLATTPRSLASLKFDCKVPKSQCNVQCLFTLYLRLDCSDFPIKCSLSKSLNRTREMPLLCSFLTNR